MENGLTSCRHRRVGVATTSNETQKEEMPGCPKKCKWPPRGMGTTVSLFLDVRPSNRQNWVNIQVKWAATQPGQDRGTRVW